MTLQESADKIKEAKTNLDNQIDMFSTLFQQESEDFIICRNVALMVYKQAIAEAIGYPGLLPYMGDAQ